MSRRLPALLALAVVACSAPPPEPPDSLPAPAAGAAQEMRGTVRVVGSAPMNVKVVLQPSQGGDVELVGPLSEEIRQLSGAEVAVQGAVGPAPDPLANRRIRVDAYEILSVEGKPVIQGTIEGRSGDWLLLRTDGGEVVYLPAEGSPFQPGQRVWVQGPRSVVVQSHGVLRR